MVSRWASACPSTEDPDRTEPDDDPDGEDDVDAPEDEDDDRADDETAFEDGDAPGAASFPEHAPSPSAAVAVATASVVAPIRLCPIASPHLVVSRPPSGTRAGGRTPTVRRRRPGRRRFRQVSAG